jgi:hypothetical protein
MDELTLVARLREDLPAGIDLSGPERRLADEIAAAAAADGAAGWLREARLTGARDARLTWDRETGADRGGPGQRGNGRRHRLVAFGAVAAAAAVTAGVVIAASQPAHQAATAGRSPSPAISAAQLVAYATRAAATGPAFDPKPDQWIYSEILQASHTAGVGGYLSGPPKAFQGWRRVDGHGFAYIQHGKLVISQPNLPRPRVSPFPEPGWPSVNYPYLESLPTDPARLMTLIKSNLRAEPNLIGADRGSNAGVFNSIQALMETVVLPPKLLAGLYGVLARDPAVHFDRSVTDLAGRTGVGFYMVQDGSLKAEIVINPVTYAYMGYQDVAVRAYTIPRSHITVFRRGQILEWEALLKSGIVQRPGQVP